MDRFKRGGTTIHTLSFVAALGEKAGTWFQLRAIQNNQSYLFGDAAFLPDSPSLVLLFPILFLEAHF